MERRSGGLEPVEFAPAHPLGDRLVGRVEEHDGRRPEPAGAPLVQVSDLVDVEFASVALVRQRRVHRPIGDDGRAGLECGYDDLGEMLGAVGSGEQRLGSGRQVVHARVVEDLADPRPDRRATGLAREDGADRRCEPFRLGRLARPLGALERDVGGSIGHGDRWYRRARPSPDPRLALADVTVASGGADTDGQDVEPGRSWIPPRGLGRKAVVAAGRPS